MGEFKTSSASIGVLTVIALLFPTASSATTDPYPNLNTGDELPDTRVWSTTETTWAEFAQTTYRAGWACPRFQTPNGDPYAWDGNGFDETVGKWWRACFKNPWRIYDQAAWDKYREDLAAAQKAAEDESRAWNEANPGRQKCVQWGPITDPYGGVSSGGVCANPVPAGTAPSGSQTVEAPSVGEGDVSGASTTSPSPTQPAPDSDTQTVSPVATTSSPVSGLDPDPAPSGGVDYRGSGYPYTVIVLGQVGLAACPTGFQAANGLIADASTRQTYTECWPERAWTAYRLGGEAWELFKATGGSYDPSVEVERRSKVELLKAKAKEVAEEAAKTTPGIERCSSWSGFGESGRECAYAFVAPSGSSPSVGDATASDAVTTSVTTRTVTESATATDSSTTSSATTESEPVSGSIAVALDTVQVTGNSIEVSRTALSVTPDPTEAASISALAEGITGVRTVQRSLLQSMPRDSNLTYKVTSATPDVCLASSWRVRIMNPGLCLVNVEITDSSGNSYEIVKRMRRLF